MLIDATLPADLMRKLFRRNIGTNLKLVAFFDIWIPISRTFAKILMHCAINSKEMILILNFRRTINGQVPIKEIHNMLQSIEGLEI